MSARSPIVERVLAPLSPEQRERVEGAVDWYFEQVQSNRTEEQELIVWAGQVAAELRHDASLAREEEQAQPASSGKPETPRWTSLDFAAIERDGIPPLDWLFRPWIVSGDIFVFAGDASIGKSTLSSRLAYAAASGGEWCGIQVTRPLRVLYIDEEESDSEVYHLFRRHGPPLPAESLRVFCQQGANLDSDEGLAIIEREIADFRPDLLEIDSATAAFGNVDGNSNQDVAAVYRRLFHLRKTYALTIGFNHHLGKPGETKRSILHRILGSVAFGTQSSAVFGAVSHDADSLELVAVKRRGAPRPYPSMIVGYREEDGRCFLENRGPVEDTAGAVAACSEWLVSHLEGLGKPAKRAELMEASKSLAEPYSSDVVDKAAKHAIKLGLAHKLTRGYYAHGKAAQARIEGAAA